MIEASDPFPRSGDDTKRQSKMQPNSPSVLESFSECKTMGEDAFLEKYASGTRPRAHYVVYEGYHFPLKAIWAASHRPPIRTRDFRTGDARKGLEAMGYDCFPPKNSN
jgi:hypothetical protein